MKVRSLRELGALRDALAQSQRDAAEREALERAERGRRDRVRQAFALAVGPVMPLRPSGRAHLVADKPPAQARQRELDEQAALREALSDEVDVESLLLTDDGLSFRRSGIGTDVLARLRRGHWAIQRQLDLHGMRREEARDALALFVRESHQQGLRCLRVVHGKGHGSPGKEPVLKAKVQRWLAQRREVIAFAQASGPNGGAGALIVLLAPAGRA